MTREELHVPAGHTNGEVMTRTQRAAYYVIRGLIHGACLVWFRLEVRGKEHLPRSGAYIVSPIHRSNLDTPVVSAITTRTLRYMGKESLWKSRPLGWFLIAMGGFPVQCGTADREALKAALACVERGEPLVMFPEGTRQEGPIVEHVFDGVAYVALRCGVPIVPVGIGGSDMGMPKGAKMIKRAKVHLVVGEAIDVKAPEAGERVPRRAVRELTEHLTTELQRLYDEAKVRRETGVATNLDVLTAEVGVANARRAVLLAEQDVKDRQDALLALIGQFQLDESIGAVHFAETSEATPVFASSYLLAKQNQPDYLSSQAAVEQLKLDLKVAKDGAKPDLTVGAALGLSGTNGSGHDAFNDALDRQSHSWQVDFAFNYPWGLSSSRAVYRQALATLNREQTRLKQIEQNIEVQVRSAVRSVETNVEAVKIAVLAAKLSEQQYELEKAKFDAGQSTSRLVLQSQDDLDAARVNALQAKVTLQSAITALHRLEGSSLQRYSIALP